MIVKRILLVAKRPDFSTQEFRTYYEGNHVPLLKRLLPFDRILYYKRNYVEPDGLHPKGTEVDYDSITEFAWPDEESFRAFVEARYKPDIADQIKRDEDRFIESIRFIAVEERNQP